MAESLRSDASLMSLMSEQINGLPAFEVDPPARVQG
jgi:hypothetical protein